MVCIFRRRATCWQPAPDSLSDSYPFRQGVLLFSHESALGTTVSGTLLPQARGNCFGVESPLQHLRASGSSRRPVGVRGKGDAVDDRVYFGV